MEQQEKTEQALSAKKIKEMKKAEKRKQKEAKKEQKAKNPGKKRKKAPVIIAAIIIGLLYFILKTLQIFTIQGKL